MKTTFKLAALASVLVLGACSKKELPEETVELPIMNPAPAPATVPTLDVTTQTQQVTVPDTMNVVVPDTVPKP